MKVLVTGASGFIGREIISELSGADHQVIGLARAEQPTVLKFPNLTFEQADITDIKTLAKLSRIEAVDAIIHAAGLAHQFGETKKEAFEAVNVRGTENVLNLAVKLQVKHFMLIGSTAIYGIRENSAPPADPNSNSAEISEDAPPNPQTLYAESKLEGERICRRICEANGIALTIFRLAPVLGAGNVGNAARLIETIDRKRFVWVGDGSNLKSLIDKRDVARACVKVLENKSGTTEIFNLAAAPISMKDLVNQIAGRLEVKVFPVKIPASVPRAVFKFNAKALKLKKIAKIAATVEKWLADDVFANDKIAAAYGFQPPTLISEAIGKQIDDYRMNKEQTGKAAKSG